MIKNKLAIFASGTGSNAINLIQYFKNHDSISVVLVLSNKDDAPVLSSAKKLEVETKYFSNEEVSDGQFLISVCKKYAIDWIVLAGYLRLIPSKLIEEYENKILNLHPSLLPNYGGKGMYGRKVHATVLANKESESGITIHYVNSEFDKGAIIAQFKCEIYANDSVEDLEKKIRQLEQNNLPSVVEEVVLGLRHQY